MARVINSNYAEFVNNQYGGMNREGYEYLQNRFNSIVDSGIMANNQAFLQNVQNNLNTMSYASVVLAETSMTGSNSMFEDGISPIYDFSRFVNASLTQQQYLAASPVIYNEIQQGRLSGWSETMPENYFNGPAELNERYREVMDGQILWADEEGAEDDVFKVYFAETFCSNPLMMNEKLITRQNWARLESMVFGGDKDDDVLDPTDQFGGYI